MTALTDDYLDESEKRKGIPMNQRTLLEVFCIAAVLVGVSSLGRAQDGQADARALFRSGTIQYERGEFRQA
ncbi:MAG: hypothetical protein AAF645_02720, partial [Myxococcota bacterium]